VSLLNTLDREEFAAARGFFLTAWNGKDRYTFDRIMRVTEHIGIRSLPFREVPLICSALYLLKEHWRYYLLEDAIDAAVGHLRKVA
jgi:hypothetical protein